MEKNKILYIDTSLAGHRTNYLKALVEENPNSIALLPGNSEQIKCKQIIMKSGYNKKRSFFNYLKWMNEIKRISIESNIDIVHFLCGDTLYRYFGIGLKRILKPIIVTYHHMKFDFFKKISIKSIFRKSKYGIVHTDYLYENLMKMDINNVKKIEYPVFLKEINIEKNIAKEKLGLPKDITCIVTFGGTQRYKGLDILLEALNLVTQPFYLYITGVERDIKLDYIKEKISKYEKSVKYKMKRLTDEEYAYAMAATDLIVLPYRFEFDGASGPMIDGVWNRKFIVGSEHGSMGNIINKYHLGRTFKTEDSNDLAKVLNDVLSTKIIWHKEAEDFRQKLTVERFILENNNIYDEI